MENNNQAAPLTPEKVLSTEDAIAVYEDNGGRLTRPTSFGVDPLANHTDLKGQRLEEFHRQFPTFEHLFSQLVNNDPAPFAEAVLYFIHLTNQNAALIL